MILDNIDLNVYPEIEGNKYLYDNRVVPRVTEILSSMLHEDYLMTWSNNIGLYNHQKYSEVLGTSADIGTYTHKAIEDFLKGSKELSLEGIPYNMHDKIDYAYRSFMQWWDIISKHDHRIILQEQELVCKYFGGTLDLLIEIDGKTYIVDFKTSNHPSYKYFLQLAAYRYMLLETMNIDTDGSIVLMLDKKSSLFRELILDFNDPYNLEYMNQCEDTFMALTYAYYQRKKSEYMYNTIFKKG